MADKLTLEDIQKEQQTLVDISEEYQHTQDPDEIEAINQKLAAAVAKLEGLLQELVDQTNAEMEAKYGTEAANYQPIDTVVEVELTSDQTGRIKEETGLEFETILLDDPRGLRSQMMPYASPEEIEALALAQARSLKGAADAEVEAAKAVTAALDDFEKDASPEAMALLEKAKEDPNFLAGMLQKDE